MKVRVQHWDAFANQPGKGNPAGIVLPRQDLSDSDMQSVARAIGFNDTAFVMPSACANFQLRYFAPKREVDLCGHATIAAFAALHAHGLLPANGATMMLETRSGLLPIDMRIDDDGRPLVVMTQANSRFAPFHGSRAELARSLAIETDDFHSELPIHYGSTGRWTLVIPVKDLGVMKRMRPVHGHFGAALADMPEASIHPFCLQTTNPLARMHARHFSSPTSGSLEDAVTGTASGVLGAYYRDHVDPHAPQPLLIEQGYEVNREGTVQVWAERDGDSYAVRIAGGATFVRNIDIELESASLGVGT